MFLYPVQISQNKWFKTCFKLVFFVILSFVNPDSVFVYFMIFSQAICPDFLRSVLTLLNYTYNLFVCTTFRLRRNHTRGSEGEKIFYTVHLFQYKVNHVIHFVPTSFIYTVIWQRDGWYFFYPNLSSLQLRRLGTYTKLCKRMTEYKYWVALYVERLLLQMGSCVDV